MTPKLQALKLAQSAIGSTGIEKLETLLRIREIVISDESIGDTSQRNSHPAFKALLESVTEVKEPDFRDIDANEAGKYGGVMSASNLVGILSSFGRLLEALKAEGMSESDILNHADVKCIVSQCRQLAGV